MPDYSFYALLVLFTIYAFVGWCLEVAYAAVTNGRFSNRGFLNGPICPIYGFGALLVIVLLEPLKHNLFILFIGSVLLTSLLEFITGYLLEKIFRDKWWDYSDAPFNIKGYVCLKFSLLWGFACVFVIDIINPMIYGLISIIPHVLGVIILTVTTLLLLIDLSITAASVKTLHTRLKRMQQIANSLHELSEDMGEHISDNVISAVKKAENSEGIEKLKQKYQELSEKRNIIHNRLLKNMPIQQNGKYKLQFEQLKIKFKR